MRTKTWVRRGTADADVVSSTRSVAYPVVGVVAFAGDCFGAGGIGGGRGGLVGQAAVVAFIDEAVQLIL